MTGTSDPRLIKRLSLYASLAAMSSVAIGLAALIGWKLDIAALFTWGAAQAIAPNSAACMGLAGLSLSFLRKSDNHPVVLAKGRAANTFAALAGLVGLLSLAEQLFKVDFGIDRLLLLAPPTARTRMSPVAAGAFMLLAVALPGIDWRISRGNWPAQFPCGVAMMGAAFWSARGDCRARRVFHRPGSACGRKLLYPDNGTAVFAPLLGSGRASRQPEPRSEGVARSNVAPSETERRKVEEAIWTDF